MLLLLILSSSGCKEKENLKDRIFSIEEADMNQEFGSTPENKIILIKTNLSLNDWKAESEANWLFLSTQEDASQGASLKISATANTSGERRTAVVKLLSPVQNYILNVTQYGSSSAKTSKCSLLEEKPANSSQDKVLKIPGMANSRLMGPTLIIQFGDSRPISRSHWSIISREVPILTT